MIRKHLLQKLSWMVWKHVLKLRQRVAAVSATRERNSSLINVEIMIKQGALEDVLCDVREEVFEGRRQ